MEKIKSDQKKVLKEILGKKWKSIPQVGKIERRKSGVIINDGDIIGLGLYSNQLTTLPESIGNLSSLKDLYLSHNELMTLPESIGNLTLLQKLYLSHNELTTLPEWIGNLESLQRLWLNDNQLTTLPESISNLISLQVLYLYNNQLSTLPESISNLKSLEYLSLRNNKLTTLPESIGNLKSLKRLDLEGNPLNQEFKKIIKMANGDIQFILRKQREIFEKERLEVEKKEMEKRYKRERPIIEKLIQKMKFSDAVLKLNDIKNTAKRYNLSEIINWTEENLILCYKPIIKKTILELGIKFARLQIAEISEVCDIDDVQLIVDIVKNMIDNKEIYAQYFSSTKSVAFDQQANIDEIDKLMSTYKDWEDKKVGKK